MLTVALKYKTPISLNSKKIENSTCYTTLIAKNTTSSNKVSTPIRPQNVNSTSIKAPKMSSSGSSSFSNFKIIPYTSSFLIRPNFIGAPGGGKPNKGVNNNFEFENKLLAKKPSSEIRVHNTNPNSKKKASQQCSAQQNKAGIESLPDSSQYIFSLETKASKKAINEVWASPEARKEVLNGLLMMDKKTLLPRNIKKLKAFDNVSEIKLNKTRILVLRGKAGAPDEIIAVLLRKRLETLIDKLKIHYK